MSDYTRFPYGKYGSRERKPMMKKSCLKSMAVIIAASLMVLSACSKGGVTQPGTLIYLIPLN